MSKAFENSRCSELVDAIAARSHGKGYSLKDAPAEVKCLAILTTKASLIQEFPELLLTVRGKAVMAELNKAFLILAPDVFTPPEEGKPTAYDRISRIFFADLQDLYDGKLDNPPL